MARPGEFEFFSTRSGLPSGTLADHQMAYYAAKGFATGTLADREYDFWLAETALTRATASYVDARYAYYDANTVDPATDIDSMMVAFFASPPAP